MGGGGDILLGGSGDSSTLHYVIDVVSAFCNPARWRTKNLVYTAITLLLPTLTPLAPARLRGCQGQKGCECAKDVRCKGVRDARAQGGKWCEGCESVRSTGGMRGMSTRGVGCKAWDGCKGTRGERAQGVWEVRATWWNYHLIFAVVDPGGGANNLNCTEYWWKILQTWVHIEYGCGNKIIRLKSRTVRQTSDLTLIKSESTWWWAIMERFPDNLL